MEKSEQTPPKTWTEIFTALDKAGVPDDFLAERGQQPLQEREPFLEEAGVTLKPTISQEESDRRRAAVESANASMRISGMGEQPPDLKALDEEFIAGRIDVDEYGRIVRGWYGLK
jgi:hypothetical protein